MCCEREGLCSAQASTAARACGYMVRVASRAAIVRRFPRASSGLEVLQGLKPLQVLLQLFGLQLAA